MKIRYRGQRGPLWLRDKVAKIEFSRTHIGWGWVVDRYGLLRIYLVPGCKITLGKLNGPLARPRSNSAE